jgi:hypothetical protein
MEKEWIYIDVGNAHPNDVNRIIENVRSAYEKNNMNREKLERIQNAMKTLNSQPAEVTILKKEGAHSYGTQHSLPTKNDPYRLDIIEEKSKPTICTKCFYYSGHKSHSQMLCDYEATTEISFQTGEEVTTYTLCDSRNPNGDCKFFIQKPTICERLISWIRRLYIRTTFT